MKYRFSDFANRHFSSPPEVIEHDGWRTQFLGFSRPEHADKVPLLFVGGAFQSFWSFRTEVKSFFDDRPVLLVDLPGQGQNEQRSERLDFDGFATVLARCLDHWKLERVVPIGLSYGAAIAYTFAAQHPQRAEQVILGGITAAVRPTLRAVLEHGLDLIARGDLDSFANGCAGHLFNLSKVARTGVGTTLLDRFRDSIRSLGADALERYRDNTQRLLRARLEQPPQSEALVFSARFDNFVMPHEAMEVARRCPKGRFVLFDDGDHLLPLEQTLPLIQLYRRFLAGEALDGVPGVTRMDPHRPDLLERRVDPRFELDLPATLEHRSGGTTQVRLVNVTFDGCLVLPDRQLVDASEVAAVRIPAADISLPVGAVKERHGVRCTFLKSDRAGTEAVLRLVTSLAGAGKA